MPEATLEFKHSKDDTDGGFDMFKMTGQSSAKAPAPHYHESLDEAVYGLAGTLPWAVDEKQVGIAPGQSL